MCIYVNTLLFLFKYRVRIVSIPLLSSVTASSGCVSLAKPKHVTQHNVFYKKSILGGADLKRFMTTV